MRVLIALFVLWSEAALGASIRGRVSYSGPPLVSTPHVVAKDANVCGATQPDESLLLGAGGGVQNAIVFMEDANPVTLASAPAAKRVLDQSGCHYLPRVLAAQVGAELEVRNSDPILHNVNASGGEGRQAFNWAFPIQGQQRRTVLSKPGLLHAQCNAGHPWMSAWIYVFNHPFFSVTDSNGAFQLAGVAPGTHSIAVWHERLGIKRLQITVPPEGATVDPEFSTKPEK